MSYPWLLWGDSSAGKVQAAIPELDSQNAREKARHDALC